MRRHGLSFSLPKWRLTRWLAEPGPDVPDDIRRALIASLYGTLPIFAGGVFNSILVAAVAAWRFPHPAILVWLGVEIVICVVRLFVLLTSFRRAERAESTPTDVYLLLGLCWAGSVGYGAAVSVLSGDWVIATLACMSAAGMVGGACFRNFGAPRFVAVMIALALGPVCVAAPFTGEWVMAATLVQIPFYLVSMRLAAYKLNGLLVATMRAEAENHHQARHDPLTGLPNRAGLMHALDDPADRRVALLYLDLDGFKAVNDGHGHAAGDRLLTSAAERLRRLLRGGDVAARIGGDEFVVVARGVDRLQAPTFGERLIRELGEPYDLGDGLTVQVGVSVGVALAPDHGEAVPDLLGAADAALYLAKASGKSRCAIAPSQDQPTPSLIGDLGEALRSVALPADPPDMPADNRAAVQPGL